MTRLQKARMLFDYEQNWRDLLTDETWSFIKSECEPLDHCMCKEIAASILLDGYPARET